LLDPEEIPAAFLFSTIPPEILGGGEIAMVSGAGVVTGAVGGSSIGTASGAGRVN
jgi:hypothetical protein